MIPTIETDRLILRPFNLADAKDVQRLAGDFRIAQTTAAIPHPYPDGLAESWISTHEAHYAEKRNVAWAIILKSNQELTGCISLMGISLNDRKAELGYWVAVECWNKGFCTEATQAAVDFSFNKLDLNKITARHMSENPASGKVMLKIGMVQEGYFAQDIIRFGKVSDSIVYGLTRDHYQKLKVNL